MKVGVIGLGGLGHMGVKYAKSFGAEVWVLTSSPEKAEIAISYGAAGVIVTKSKEEMDKYSEELCGKTLDEIKQFCLDKIMTLPVYSSKKKNKIGF
jgi:D-arabinose 1-dehydrogenase-like Zn-dependent alcohol dehydrogenase